MKKLIALCLTFVLLVSGITISYAADSTVVSVEPAGGTNDSPAVLSVHPGQFVITFSDDVTKDIFSNITFTDAEGNEVKGGIYPSIDTDNNDKVIVKYGALENKKKYILKIGTTEYNYLAKGFEIIEDFENPTYYTLGEVPVNHDNWVFDPALGKLIVKKENNNQYLRGISVLEHQSVEGDTTVKLVNGPENKYVTAEGMFYIDMRVRGTGATADATGRPREVLVFRFVDKENDPWVQEERKTFEVRDNKPGINGATADADGFYNFRFIVKRESTGEDGKGRFYVSVTDKNNTNEPGKVLATYSTSEGKALVGPDIIRLMHLNAWAGSGECYFDLDDVHIATISQSDLLHTNIDNLARNHGEFYVAFSNDIDVNSAKNLTIKDAEENEIAVVLDEEKSTDRKAVYKLKEYLAPSTNYSLEFNGIKDVYGGEIKTSEYEFTSLASVNAQLTEETIKADGSTVSGEELPSTATAVTLTTKVKNNSGVASDFVMCVIVYDKDGRIEKVYQDTENNVAVGANVTLEVNTGSTGDTLGEGYSVKRFAWRVDSEKGAISVVPPIRLAKPVSAVE